VKTDNNIPTNSQVTHYLSNAPIATHDEVSFNGLHQREWVNLDWAAVPLFQIGARRMAL